MYNRQEVALCTHLEEWRNVVGTLPVSLEGVPVLHQSVLIPSNGLGLILIESACNKASWAYFNRRFYNCVGSDKFLELYYIPHKSSHI